MKHAKHPAHLAAAASGEKRWQGPPCDHCDGAERWTSTGQCVECNRRASREQGRQKAKNPAVIAARQAKRDA